MIFMLYSGLSQALSIRVSNSLGAGTPGVAKRATWAAESLGLVLSAAAGVALAAGAQQWPRLFTNIPDVVSTTALLMPIFAITLPGDGTNVVLQGMLRCVCYGERKRCCRACSGVCVMGRGSGAAGHAQVCVRAGWGVGWRWKGVGGCCRACSGVCVMGRGSGAAGHAQVCVWGGEEAVLQGMLRCVWVGGGVEVEGGWGCCRACSEVCVWGRGCRACSGGRQRGQQAQGVRVGCALASPASSPPAAVPRHAACRGAGAQKLGARESAREPRCIPPALLAPPRYSGCLKCPPAPAAATAAHASCLLPSAWLLPCSHIGAPTLLSPCPAVSNIASFWCFGIPLSYYLAFPRGLGIRGLWWGLFAVNCEVMGGEAAEGEAHATGFLPGTAAPQPAHLL
jgi:hypothetical protein